MRQALRSNIGSTIEVGMIGVEGMVGVPAFLGGNLSAQQVIVQIPGTALRMSAALCKAAFDQSAAVRKLALRFTEAILNLSAQTAACNRLHSIEQRCARWLLMALDRIQSDRMPLTHEFLASMLGVRRAGITNTAGDLQRSGLIRYHHGQLTIVDREGLEAMACECHRIDHDRLIPAALMAARPFGRVEKFAAFVRQRTDKQQPWRHSLKSDVER